MLKAVPAGDPRHEEVDPRARLVQRVDLHSHHKKVLSSNVLAAEHRVVDAGHDRGGRGASGRANHVHQRLATTHPRARAPAAELPAVAGDRHAAARARVRIAPAVAGSDTHVAPGGSRVLFELGAANACAQQQRGC